MRVTHFDAFRSLLVVFVLIPGVPISEYGFGQQAQSPAATQPSLWPDARPSSEPNPMEKQAADRMTDRRNADRQKRIVDDTAKLYALAEELRDEVAKSNKDELSLDVVHKAEEIEKLAKSVKERMRDGQ